MMEKQDIYCELNFLTSFFSQIPNNQFSFLEEPPEMEIWRDYYKLFTKNCSLTIDNEDEFNKLIDNEDEFNKLVDNKVNLFVKLNKRKYDGEIDIRFNDIESAILPEEKVDTLYFLTDKEKCEQLEEDYGLLFISNDTLFEKANLLFSPNNFPIEKDKRKIENWNFLNQYVHPCNTMVVVDNYILGKTEEIKNNLIPLLDKLLPNKLKKINFQLTIITGDNKTNINAESRYELINSAIKEQLKRPYDIDLKIITKAKDNHDRDIITNYLHIGSDAGFNIFRNNKTVKSNTKLKVNPIIGYKGGIRNVVNSLKKQYSIIDKNAINIGSERVVWPNDSRTDRLLTNI